MYCIALHLILNDPTQRTGKTAFTLQASAQGSS